MPSGGTKGNAGNQSNHPRKWETDDFATLKLPRHIKATIYRVAYLIETRPDLEQKLNNWLDES